MQATPFESVHRRALETSHPTVQGSYFESNKIAGAVYDQSRISETFLYDPSLPAEAAAVKEFYGTLLRHNLAATDRWHRYGTEALEIIPDSETRPLQSRAKATVAFFHARSLIRRVVEDVTADEGLAKQAASASLSAIDATQALRSRTARYDIMFAETMLQNALLNTLSIRGNNSTAQLNIGRAKRLNSQLYNRQLPVFNTERSAEELARRCHVARNIVRMHWIGDRHSGVQRHRRQSALTLLD